MTDRETSNDRGAVIRVLLGIDCQADTVISHNGARVWLKDAFSKNGRRIGVAACCLQSAPCMWHDTLGRIVELGIGARRQSCEF